jgi:uncharacterized membrane protein
VDIGKIFGLPAHPLFVHIPVVLIPLAGVGGVWIALSSKWRAKIGWIVVALAGVGLVGSWLAIQSGRTFYEALNDQSQLLEQHTDLGNTFLWFALALFISILALVLWDRAQARKAVQKGGEPDRKAMARTPIAMALSVLVIAATLAAGFQIYRIGESGAKSVWQEDVQVFNQPAGS